jgi:Arc/MetJ-type ribon-helix-helix transcriptional regulator
MELDAVKKVKEQREAQAKTPKKEPKAKPVRKPVISSNRAGEREPSSLSEKPVSETIQIYYSTLHYSTVQNTLTAQHNQGDFTYNSVSDLIRAALEAYKNGMQLTELDQKGEKTSLKIRVDKDLKAFFDSLPGQMKSKITERAVRTFIKNGFR